MRAMRFLPEPLVRGLVSSIDRGSVSSIDRGLLVVSSKAEILA
jgi:hypothetical protein